ncbi:hypothetical protein [Ornithinimicrobium kibberense]|uniref:hypothetical protein n=1 Tax=Ornithinimicrobium kibberense TaxID=282060 RepID=UPI00361878BE
MVPVPSCPLGRGVQVGPLPAGAGPGRGRPRRPPDPGPRLPPAGTGRQRARSAELGMGTGALGRAGRRGRPLARCRLLPFVPRRGVAPHLRQGGAVERGVAGQVRSPARPGRGGGAARRADVRARLVGHVRRHQGAPSRRGDERHPVPG